MAKKEKSGLIETESPITPLTNTNSIDSQFDMAKQLIELGMVPASYRTPQQVVLAIAAGKSLGLDPINSVNSIDIIQGNPAIKAKMLAGILTKAGISIRLIDDYKPIYKESNGVPIMKTDPNNPEKKILDLDSEGRIQYYKDDQGNKIIKKGDPIDYVTTIEFKRFFPNGIGVVTNVVSFKWSDAVQAKWHTKDNWKKLPKFMLTARCIARGSRIVASDIVAGMYTDYEVAEFTNSNFSINTDGNVVIQHSLVQHASDVDKAEVVSA